MNCNNRTGDQPSTTSAVRFEAKLARSLLEEHGLLRARRRTVGERAQAAGAIRREACKLTLGIRHHVSEGRAAGALLAKRPFILSRITGNGIPDLHALTHPSRTEGQIRLMRRGKGETRQANAAPHTSTCTRCSHRVHRATVGNDANTEDVGAHALLLACLLLLQIASRKLRLKRLRALCVSPRISTPIDFRKKK